MQRTKEQLLELESFRDELLAAIDPLDKGGAAICHAYPGGGRLDPDIEVAWRLVRQGLDIVLQRIRKLNAELGYTPTTARKKYEQDAQARLPRHWAEDRSRWAQR